MGQNDSTFKVTATPQQRFFLAQAFFSPTLKFKDRTKERLLYRARKQLGLMGPSEWIAERGRVGEIWQEKKSFNVFEVTEETAAFVVTTIGELEKEPFQSFMLEGLLQQLEAKRDADSLDMALPLDEEAEAPLWKPSLKPILVNPDRFTDVLKDVVQAAESYGAFRTAMLKVLEMPEIDALPGKTKAA